jgi:6-pyruvoyltetrahydropterin/6-carboxytetrahydropterin synthase
MFELMVETTFDAAHQLIDCGGPCENIHGHTWKVQVFLKGEKTDKLGMVIDFKKIKEVLGEVIKKYDHTSLNLLPQFEKLSPTCENVARVVYQELKTKLPEAVRLSKVTVWESAGTCAAYYEND